jgi:hypothetical protein
LQQRIDVIDEMQEENEIEIEELKKRIDHLDGLNRNLRRKLDQRNSGADDDDDDD